MGGVGQDFLSIIVINGVSEASLMFQIQNNEPWKLFRTAFFPTLKPALYGTSKKLISAPASRSIVILTVYVWLGMNRIYFILQPA